MEHLGRGKKRPPFPSQTNEAATCGLRAGRHVCRRRRPYEGVRNERVRTGTSNDAGHVKNAEWLQKAAAQGEPVAMFYLAHSLLDGTQSAEMKQKAERLLRDAAELGHVFAQEDLAIDFCEERSPEWFAWMRRSFLQQEAAITNTWPKRGANAVELYDNQPVSGRSVFEFGSGLSSSVLWRERSGTSDLYELGARALELFEKWCNHARRAVQCWLWLSKQLGMGKDIRLVIADLIWDERAVWSDRRCE